MVTVGGITRLLGYFFFITSRRVWIPRGIIANLYWAANG